MTKTHNTAYVAILSALSFLLMYFKFPLLPAASFLEVDFSIVPILIGLCLLGLRSAFGILAIRTILKLLLNNSGPSTLIGIPMNVVAVSVFLLSMALIWWRKPSVKSYILGAVVGTVGMTLAMLVLNYVYAVPLYALYAQFDIAKVLGISQYLFAMVVPFNLLQGALFSVVFYGLWLTLHSYFKEKIRS